VVGEISEVDLAGARLRGARPGALLAVAARVLALRRPWRNPRHRALPVIATGGDDAPIEPGGATPPQPRALTRFSARG
jgi:hypothetical protein